MCSLIPYREFLIQCVIQVDTLRWLCIGHIGVNTHLHLFNISDEPYCTQNSCMDLEIPETIEHFMLYCPAYSGFRKQLLDKLKIIDIRTLSLKCLPLGDESLSHKHNLILSYVIEYIYNTKRAEVYF